MKNSLKIAGMLAMLLFAGICTARNTDSAYAVNSSLHYEMSKGKMRAIADTIRSLTTRTIIDADVPIPAALVANSDTLKKALQIMNGELGGIITLNYVVRTGSFWRQIVEGDEYSYDRYEFKSDQWVWSQQTGFVSRTHKNMMLVVGALLALCVAFMLYGKFKSKIYPYGRRGSFLAVFAEFFWVPIGFGMLSFSIKLPFLDIVISWVKFAFLWMLFAFIGGWILFEAYLFLEKVLKKKELQTQPQ